MPAMRPHVFWILTTPRSGSNFVTAELWRRLGGRPKGMEYLSEFGVGQQPDFVPDPDAPVRSYLDHLMRRESFAGVLAVKMLWEQMDLCRKYPDFVSELAGRKIILLQRRDVVRQGISYHLSLQSGWWVSCSTPRIRPPEEVPYDHAAIRAAVKRAENHHAHLRGFLTAFGLEHLHVWYEDFVASPDAEAARIFDHLGLTPTSGTVPVKTPFERQSSEINERFYERFLADERTRLAGDGSFRGPPIFARESVPDART